jgi:hypothetical protein
VGQIRQPVYAANRFYDELVKIAGYQTMRITEAAQKVQRSGYPEAYQDHAEDGRALGETTSAGGVAGTLTLGEPDCGGDDSQVLTARVSPVGSDRTAEPYLLERAGGW